MIQVDEEKLRKIVRKEVDRALLAWGFETSKQFKDAQEQGQRPPRGGSDSCALD